jgi:S-DNA-T family DNA segregation ATPase FtsK/SpoIIIE
MSATVHQLHPRPDLHEEEGDRPVIAPVPTEVARVALTDRTVAVVAAARKHAGPAARGTVAHAGLSLAGTWRGAGAVWRWAVADEYGKHKDTRPDLVEKTRERRQKWGRWGALAVVVGVQQLAVRWPHLTIVAAIVVFVVAGVVERRIRAGSMPEDAGRKALGKHPGAKAVRRVVADVKLGKVDEIRVIGPVTRDGDAWTAMVEPPGGTTYQAAQKRIPELAAAIGVGLSQVAVDPVRGHNGRFILWCADADPLSAPPIPSPLLDADRWNIWRDRVPMGRDVRGRPVSFALPERSILVSGEAGGGKSVACANLLCAVALDPFVRLVLADAKGVDLIDFADMAEVYIGRPEPPRLLAALGDVQAEMDERYAAMARARIKTVTEEFAAEHDIYPLLIHIDELAFYMRSDLGPAITEALRDIVSRGRASLIIVSAATQRPSSKIIDTDLRDLISIRMSMRVTTPESSDMGLGRGWAKQGFDASRFDATQRGAALLLAEGTTPVAMRTGMLTDKQITAICRRAYSLREQAGTLPKSDARPAVRLLKQVLAAMGDREKVPTADLLAALPEHTAESLADALRPLGVRPDDLWIDSRSQRGYRRADVMRALERA